MTAPTDLGRLPLRVTASPMNGAEKSSPPSGWVPTIAVEPLMRCADWYREHGPR